jgi:hypothetical protein
MPNWVGEMGLRVEYFYDDESRHWGFVVPSLNIVGGGAETREEAEEVATSARRWLHHHAQRGID